MIISCAIYADDGIILLSSPTGTVLIPEELASFPRISTTPHGSRILLNEGSNDPNKLEVIKQHIQTLLNYYEDQGIVRIETPSFYEMIIYNSNEELLPNPYPNIDDLINSFLCSKGAEYIV